MITDSGGLEFEAGAYLLFCKQYIVGWLPTDRVQINKQVIATVLHHCVHLSTIPYCTV